jgi:hypothetical protein
MHTDLIQCLEEYSSIKQRNRLTVKNPQLIRDLKIWGFFLITARQPTLPLENQIIAFKKSAPQTYPA